MDVALLPPAKVSLFHHTVVGIPNFCLDPSVPPPPLIEPTFTKSYITSEDAVKTALHSGKLLSVNSDQQFIDTKYVPEGSKVEHME